MRRRCTRILSVREDRRVVLISLHYHDGSEAQSGSSREQGLERLAWIDRGTCAPLPFHVTGGQPAVGQGVVVHARGFCLQS
ncbi:unnamed protein product [Spirodela intermedia]|uniref:Uncharacterized protein n=1 Tax=Spirodela intermedia TaxID=51605 RepID=A0A7I8K5C9_SPIIN|nr:unnamed protein product [Spirodela intermedia]